MDGRRYRTRESATTVTAEIDRPVRAVFDALMDLELDEILVRWGPLPAVGYTEPIDGPASFDEVRAKRLVVMDDSSTLEEELTVFEPPVYFVYEIGEFDFSLRHLVERGRGEWTFTPIGESMIVKWTYAFDPASALTMPLMFLYVTTLHRRYMQATMENTQALIENRTRTAGA